MLGSLAGDIIGQPYEFNKLWKTEKNPHFQPLFQEEGRFTDDSVLSIAVANVFLQSKSPELVQLDDFIIMIKKFARLYPHAGYGGSFFQWMLSNTSEPYGSWGNGSAMRVGPIAYCFSNLEDVQKYAAWSAEITHNHPEGVKGAQATATAIFLARTGWSKKEIQAYIETNYKYRFDFSIAEVRPTFKFDVSCQGTVPFALQAFFESENFEHAVRLAISLGGDTDTLACITGSIAEAFYGGVPKEIQQQVAFRLTPDLLQVVQSFCSRFQIFSKSYEKFLNYSLSK